ncbi:MAG TPA: DUF167 domain-containing protein [Candidatus Eisenbacteria bacterium]|nr:DUF167 domain-containing protein [Candidatus Eisenbacteria bacterium]
MRFQVRVTPKSRADEIRASRADGSIRVRVTAAPADGDANEAVLALLGKQLGLPRRAIRLVGGAASRVKWIEADGLEEAELWRRLEAKP